MYVWHPSHGGECWARGLWKHPTRSHCCTAFVRIHYTSRAARRHHRSLAYDCLFSGPDTGGSLSEGKCWSKRNKMGGGKASRLNVQRDALIPRGTDFCRERLGSWLSACGSHYISSSWLSPLLHLPLERDLKDRQRRSVKKEKQDSQDLASQGPDPKCLRPEGGKTGFLFMDLRPWASVPHYSTANEATRLTKKHSSTVAKTRKYVKANFFLFIWFVCVMGKNAIF